MTAEIFMIHENPEWLPPFAAAFADRNACFTDWNMADHDLDLGQTPPEGVFYNRMSASSFTRGHDRVPELPSITLAWLERHGRRVINGSRALSARRSPEKHKGPAISCSTASSAFPDFGMASPESTDIRCLHFWGKYPVLRNKSDPT